MKEHSKKSTTDIERNWLTDKTDSDSGRQKKKR